MKTLVLIPAYNEDKKIGDVVSDVKSKGIDVLVVDDGSMDQTSSISLKKGAIVLKHKINRGQGAAIATGIEYAKRNHYEVVVFFDADGQMKSEEIRKLIDPVIKNESEVVLGSRFLGLAKNIPISKLLVLKLAILFTRLTTGLKLTDTHNGFQAWSMLALDKINLTQDRQAYASELLQEISENNIKYKEVPVTIEYTDYSKQKGQSIFNAINIVFNLLIKK
ncbi:glycosyltransferase family 2 protein [Candidatus Falkowbacteria bacterium]|uniref:Glycosyltransferase family 2 protein n=1 Tax=Candidatus Buchananbacteria bacterium CG10_big_fil_rev_8_21_14_0_10_33_19 TaxID=1974525 RepID=A0A2H0W3B3_9BACT|nr:glycosyltransferase family 2 protein [Candidatus Falkowbacteria bacterium]PIS05852.1 MAG: glycosyltransferase family 2 protein [Candidatus Buchananbacteria bacterium CG10_big_fil_rev_8_21_14_0_10_33_19]